MTSVLSFLAKAWAYDESDPRAFSEWRASHGLQEKNIPIAVLAEQKNAFEQEQQDKRILTRRLLEGLTVGPHASKFFASLSGSSEFKILAYTTAGALYRNEEVLFALSALSQENKWIIEQSIKAFPKSPVFRTFTEYVNGARIPLAFTDGTSELTSAELPIDRLFRLATMRLIDLAPEVRRTASDHGALLQLAETLLDRLPNRTFGQFARLNLCVFVCVAGSRGRWFDEAKRILISTGEPASADVLRLIGKDQILSQIRDSEQLQLSGRERLVAALIDGLRLSCAGDQQCQEEVQRFASSPTPVVALAARAGLVERSKADKTRFESLLVRTLQRRDKATVEWLSRNPEFVRYLRIDKLSAKALRVILDSYRTSAPKLALEIIAQVLRRRSGREPQRYWEEAIRALTTIERREADRVFCEFLLKYLERGEPQTIDELVAREPASSLFRRNLQLLLERTNTEQDWAILFDLYGSRTTGSELASLLEWSAGRNVRLEAWISSSLVPALLERETLSPAFHRSISNREVLIAISKKLAADTVKSIERIQSLAKDWDATRSATKQKLLSSIQTGVRIALNNTLGGTTLHSQLSRVSQSVQDWSIAESPRLEPSIESLASTRLPAAVVPSSDAVQQILRSPTPGLSDFTLFAGVNPWALDLTLRQDSGSWPKPELLLDLIATTFVHVARSRKGVEEQSQNLPKTVRVELAVALRDILSDIESSLAGYFAFRDVLDRNGLHPVMERLGVVIEQKDLSSEKHKFVRDSGRRGRPRVFGLGISVDNRTVGSGLIMNSGDEDDRD